ncbi:hypothetical protein [Halomonas cupida]|uniref:hypothetical protein n=1 Tax=Halomonas cupida TaxID=44933 RepID=UPI003A8D5958
MTLVALVVLKRLGIISFGFDRSATGEDGTASSKSSGSRRDGVSHRGEIVAHGSAPYQFDEANRLSYYITLRTGRGDDRTVWGAISSASRKRPRWPLVTLSRSSFSGVKRSLSNSQFVMTRGMSWITAR